MMLNREEFEKALAVLCSDGLARMDPQLLLRVAVTVWYLRRGTASLPNTPLRRDHLSGNLPHPPSGDHAGFFFASAGTGQPRTGLIKAS
ncbi:hypothetical protein [Duganella caerulea]|uniref:hypothetical protein n=1 Tax=Duganella caerulea TaxID=2885762 RepID=UPI0040384959